ncbi:MAG: shikimate dehydrogenase [Acidobacteria bacterium]|nr:shikimate dehydrogenase [Acidobacteriota bacterium]
MCAQSVTELEEACARASESADFVELRVDCLAETVPDLSRLVSGITKPVILTFRPAEQGGYRVLGRPEREAFWAKNLKSDWFCDIESDLQVEFGPSVIVSHHDFSGVPQDLEQLYERMAATPARVVKIAVHANDITDCIPIFQLLDRARREKRELIAIAMGNAGIATRVLGPSRGAFLTYASLEDESATAPGQINARQLRSVYRIDQIDQETMICGLVGLPVMHSVSPHMHNAAFAAEGVNGVYLPLEVNDLAEFMKRMVHPRTRELDWNLRGLSVTAPHKSAVIDFLNDVDPLAQEIGAVNTVVVEGHELRGYNTDVHGLVEPLRERLGSLKDLRVAVIGAGGAARAAVWALGREQARVTLFVRDAIKGGLLGDEFGVPCERLEAAAFSGYDVVINATPQSPGVAEQLNGAGLVYDLIYNPIETQFLKEARHAGCQTLGGLPMLVAQASRQFQLWTGKEPSTNAMYGAAAAALRQ